MLEWLGTKLAGTVLASFFQPVINGLLTMQKQKLDAAGSHEARVTELTQANIALDKREAELNAATVVAEQGNWVTRSIRPLLSIPVIILMFKILVYDKALGQWTHGTTDSLSTQIWWYCTTVTVAYMGGRTVEKVATKIAGIWK